MKKSKESSARDLAGVPFFASDAFHRFPSPLAWLAGPTAGRNRKTLALSEKPYRKSHVAIERLRHAPSPEALLDLLRSLLPDLKVSPVQTTVYLAWAEVLLRECKDSERFALRGLEVNRVALAAVFLQAAATLRSTPPFQWIHLYLESLLDSASPEGSPSDAVERATAALECAAEAREASSVRVALTRVVNSAREHPKESAERVRPHLILRKDGNCLLLGAAVVSLSPREFTLLLATAEGRTLSPERAVELLARQPPRSGMAAAGIVEEGALRSHRRGILTKVGKKAGKESKDLLAKAFHTEKRVFVYDSEVLPFTIE